MTDEPRASRFGWLKNGNPPGDPSKALRCGARTRGGSPYAAQMEALKRYRSGGEQKMTVEHVHVHPGAQAIVGNASRSGGGGSEI
jgi:hypothetical protein